MGGVGFIVYLDEGSCECSNGGRTRIGIVDLQPKGIGHHGQESWFIQQRLEASPFIHQVECILIAILGIFRQNTGWIDPMG